MPACGMTQGALCVGGRAKVRPYSGVSVPRALVWTPGPTWCFTNNAGTTRAGDGDAVAVWKGRNTALSFIQTTAANRPTLRLVSGIWYLQFDGSNDYLYILNMPAVAQPFAVTMALRSYTGGTGDAILYRGSDTLAVGYRSGGGATFSMFAGAELNVPANYSATCIRIDQYDGASSAQCTNDTEVTGDAGAQALTTLNATLGIMSDAGGAISAAAYLGEFMIVPGGLSAAERRTYRESAYTRYLIGP